MTVIVGAGPSLTLGTVGRRRDSYLVEVHDDLKILIYHPSHLYGTLVWEFQDRRLQSSIFPDATRDWAEPENLFNCLNHIYGETKKLMEERDSLLNAFRRHQSDRLVTATKFSDTIFLIKKLGLALQWLSERHYAVGGIAVSPDSIKEARRILKRIKKLDKTEGLRVFE